MSKKGIVNIVDRIVDFTINHNLKTLYLDGTGLGLAIIDGVKEELGKRYKEKEIKIIQIQPIPTTKGFAFKEVRKHG